MLESIFTDNRLEVEVAAVLCNDATVECGGGLSARFFALVSFQRALHNVGDSSIFAAGKPVGNVSRLRTAYRKLWFSHLSHLASQYSSKLTCHQDGS